MEFLQVTLPDREILVGFNVQYDSLIMEQLGQDYAAKKAEIGSNPEHEIVVYVPEEPTE